MRAKSHTTRRELVSWRVALLSDAGFSEGLAQRVAADGAYDLHALLELVDRGCPPELAVRILAPLETEHGTSARPR
jgi:hypothetical protein